MRRVKSSAWCAPRAKFFDSLEHAFLELFEGALELAG